MPAERCYEFGEFRLDPTGQVLFRGCERVPLTPKAVELLIVLVENRGNPVGREELLDKVWCDAIVEEGSLTSHVSLIRKALSDGVEGRQFIETIPKRGYRFVAPVRLADDAPPQTDPKPPLEPATAPVEIPVPAWLSAPAMEQDKIPAEPVAPVGRAARWAILVAVILVAAGYFPAKRLWTHYRPPHPARTLAVLPFQNLTGDPSQEYISDGLTEEMITQLGALRHDELAVIARTSAMAYKGTSKDVKQIGRELGVDYVLEGSMRSWGDHSRISAQLIQTRDRTHLWAHTYETDRSDILKMQSDVAQSIAREISITLTPEQQGRLAKARTVDPQVYELCLRGRFEWNKRTDASINKAIALFEEAILRDPNYAPAFAGLADSYAVLAYYGKSSSSRDLFSKAQIAAKRAIQLDDSLVEAHTTLGLIEVSAFNWPGAEREYKRAFDLNSNYATAHHWYSFLLWATGRQREAVAEIDRARQLDPFSLIILADEARLYYQLHDQNRAISLLHEALEINPNFAEAHRNLAMSYAQQKRFADALAEAEKGTKLDPNDAQRATLAYVYALNGRRQEALKMAADLKRSASDPSFVQFYVCFVPMALKQNDEALDCLESAYQTHSLNAGDIESEPIFDPLHSDPRYQDLVKRSSVPLKSI